MIWKLILLGLGAFVWGAIIHAPADKIVAHALPDNVPVQLYDVSGTVLQGRIGEVRVQGKRIEDASWQIHPGALLTGTASMDVEARGYGAWIRGEVEKGLFGNTVTASNVQATASLEQLKPLLRIPFMPVTGDISAQIDELRMPLGATVPEHVAGQLRFGNAKFLLTRPPSDLGSFAATVTTDDDGVISAEFADAQSVIDVEGRATLQPDGAYQLNGKLKPKAETPEPLVNNLKTLGRTDRQGWYPLKFNGQLR